MEGLEDDKGISRNKKRQRHRNRWEKRLEGSA